MNVKPLINECLVLIGNRLRMQLIISNNLKKKRDTFLKPSRQFYKLTKKTSVLNDFFAILKFHCAYDPNG